MYNCEDLITNMKFISRKDTFTYSRTVGSARQTHFGFNLINFSVYVSITKMKKCDQWIFNNG